MQFSRISLKRFDVFCSKITEIHERADVLVYDSETISVKLIKNSLESYKMIRVSFLY